MATTDDAASAILGAGRGRRGPSIGGVARLARASPQTVSRVSTGALNVRTETRRRVVDAMEQLGYSPDDAARALRYGSFRTIGLLSSSPTPGSSATARPSAPPLTTVRQDVVELGERRIELLLRQIDAGRPLDDEHVLVPTTLVVRGSTAPPSA